MNGRREYDKQRERRNPPHVPLGCLRLVANMTLDQVCELASEVLATPLTRGALSAIENGHRGASPEVLHALEVAYGLPEGSLVVDYRPRSARQLREQVPA